MVKKFLLSLLIALPFTVLAQLPKKLALDNLTFVIKTTKEGKKKPLDDDDLKFTSGKFKSVLWADWGYVKAGKYEIVSVDSTTSPITYTWTGELLTEDLEKLIWQGSVMGEEITGTIEYLNKKGVSKENYAFTGSLKKKGGAKK